MRGMVWVFTVLGLMLSGCAIRDAHKSVEEGKTQIQSAMESSKKNFEKPGLIRTDRPLLGAQKVSVKEDVLPEKFSQEITFVSMGTQRLAEILDTLSAMTGISFDIQDVVSDSKSTQADTMDVPGGSLQSQALAYRFQGRLSAALDDLAARVKATWKYDPDLNRVIFYQFESRVFGLALPSGEKQVTSSISVGGIGGGEGGGGSSGGTVSVSSNMKIDPWSSVMDGIRILLGDSQKDGAAAGGGSSKDTVRGDDGYAVANRDLAQIIVVARPKILGRVATYVEQMNIRFARNVLIDVRVLELQANQESEIGFSAKALFQTALKAQGLDVFDVGVVGASIPQIGSTTPSAIQITAKRTDPGNMMDIDGVIQALAGVSNVMMKNQGQIVAINGQPASFQQVNQASYLQSVQTTLTPDAGAQTSYQPGQVTVGFTANFLPIILADNRIMLQYQIQSSSLLGLRDVGAGDTKIQVPEIYSQSLQQQAYLHDGDILVLFGFEQERSQMNNSVGFLSAGSAANKKRTMTAVIIQAHAAKHTM